MSHRQARRESWFLSSFCLGLLSACTSTCPPDLPAPEVFLVTLPVPVLSCLSPLSHLRCLLSSEISRTLLRTLAGSCTPSPLSLGCPISKGLTVTFLVLLLTHPRCGVKEFKCTARWKRSCLGTIYKVTVSQTLRASRPWKKTLKATSVA